MVDALAMAGVSLAVVVNPHHVCNFARAVGQLAKTDMLDVQVLAYFAQVSCPAPRPLPDEQAQELVALMARRRQLIGMLIARYQHLVQSHHCCFLWAVACRGQSQESGADGVYT